MEDLKKASEKYDEKLNEKLLVQTATYPDFLKNQTIGSVPISLKAAPVTEDTQMNFF